VPKISSPLGSPTLKPAVGGRFMPRNPRKTWEYFARAVIQEQDPEELSYLMQKLYRALDEDENE
jgi:hypothetical protein